MTPLVATDVCLRNVSETEEEEFGHHGCRGKKWLRRKRERSLLASRDGRVRLGCRRKGLLTLLQYLLTTEDQEPEQSTLPDGGEATSIGKKGNKCSWRRKGWIRRTLEQAGITQEGGTDGIGTSKEGAEEERMEEADPESGVEPREMMEEAGTSSGNEVAKDDWRRRLIAELCEKLFGSEGTSGAAGEEEQGSTSGEENQEMATQKFGCRRKRFGKKHFFAEDGQGKSHHGMKKHCKGKKHAGKHFIAEDGQRKSHHGMKKHCKGKKMRHSSSSSSSSSSEDESERKELKKLGKKRCMRRSYGPGGMQGRCHRRGWDEERQAGVPLLTRRLLKALLGQGGHLPQVEAGRERIMHAWRGMGHCRNKRLGKRLMHKKAWKRFC